MGSILGTIILREGDLMEELLCNVEIVKDHALFVARIQSALGGVREYSAENFEDLLDQFVIDLQEEFDTF